MLGLAATCDDGVLRVVPGYWPLLVTSPAEAAADSVLTVMLTACPPSVCVGGSLAAPCRVHRVGQLCGSCAPGFSQSVSSVDCARVSADEAAATAAWFVPASLAVAAACELLRVLVCARSLPGRANQRAFVRSRAQMCCSSRCVLRSRLAW